MDSEEAKSVFLHLVEHVPPDKWQDQLGEICGENQGLKADVAVLLRAHQLEGDLAEEAREVCNAVLPMDTPSSVDFVGSQIGPYRLREKIGDGGMGVVYVAEQRAPLRRKVALKIIKPGMASPEVNARFEAERQALALMDHPNIANVLDGGQTQLGQPYFVMELVRGKPITEFADEVRFSARERLKLFVKVCHAVQHAHQKGIIHRDLKPSNVMVSEIDEQPVPKVIDFGIAKAVGHDLVDETIYTQFSQMVGTPLYMSPEQAASGVIDVDTRSDIYSLGVLLYELLTGLTPFDADTLREKGLDEFRRILREDEPQRPSEHLRTLEAEAATTVCERRCAGQGELSRELRGELDWIVMKALEKDRNRRFQTATALASDINRYLDGLPVEAGPPSFVYRTRKLLIKHKLIAAAFAAVAASLLIGLAGTLWQAQAAQRERVRAEQSEQIAKEEAGRAREEADRARNEAEVSQAVNAFLNEDLLGQADPKNEPDRNIKLRTILDRASNSIEGRFSESPLVKATIHDTLSQTYQALGELDQARRHRENAIEIWKRLLGKSDPRTWKSQVGLASITADEGDYEEAEQMLREIILGAEAGDDPLVRDTTLEAEHHLAVLLDRQSHHEDAAELYTQLLDVYKRDYGSNAPETLQVMNNLGVLRNNQGNLKEAERLLDYVVEKRMQELGALHVATMCSRENLANVWVDQGRYAEAERTFKELYELRSSLLGEEHRRTLASKHNLAVTWQMQGRYHEAAQAYREIISVREREIGEAHPLTLSTKNNLADVLQRLDQAEEAAGLLESVIADKKEVLGPDHRDTFTSIANLAAIYIDLGRFEEAEVLLKDLIERSGRTLGEQHFQTLNANFTLANLYTELEKYKEAEKQYQILLKTFRSEFGEGHPNTLVIQSNLAFVLGEQGRWRESEELSRSTLEAKIREHGRESVGVLSTMANLARALNGQSRYTEAEPVAREEIEISERLLGNEHSNTAEGLEELAASLEGQQKLKEAASAYARLGRIHLGNDEYQEAITHFQKAKKLEPNNPLYAELSDAARRQSQDSQSN